MNLPDALLNAKKYIREPKYSQKDRMWYYEKYEKGRWTAYYFLVDAVNELQKQIDKVSCAILDLATPDGENKALESIKAELEPVDPYAEQRKCLCKLCWFWNDDETSKVIGILTGVFDEADRPFERNINQTLYKHCEPVKPDDSIIYKGDDNE